MTIIRNVAFYLVIILLVLLISPIVTAYDSLESQYFTEGENSLKLGNATEALASFDKALAINPRSPVTWSYRGNALYSLKRYTEAVESYDKAIAISLGGDYDVWYNRGNALNELGRYSEAVYSYDKAIELQPEHIDAKKNREIALQKQIQEHQTSATPLQIQTKATPLPQQSSTTLVQKQAQQQSKTAPLLYAPIGAIVLMIGIALWSRHQDPPRK